MDINLYNGDCLIEMNKIQDSSVDLIFTDLPYGTTACEWDSIIPLDKMWNQINRIKKKNTAILFTASQPFTTTLISSNFSSFRYEWIWEKSQGTNPFNANIMPLKRHESILVFYDAKPTYNPQMTSGKPYSAFKSDSKGIGEVYGENSISTHKENFGTRYPTSIIHFKHDSEKYHPTQKPVDLVEYFVKTYSNIGDTVLDFTMGSGTTGVASKINERNFIGIELDSNYFNIAKDRIDSVGGILELYE